MRFATLAFCALFATSTAYAANYEIDSAHSTVGFRIRHLAITNVNGQFADFKGKFFYDPANVKNSSTEAVIQVASVNTADAKRDDHLRNPDFFEVAKFPTMTFKSREVMPGEGNTFKLKGDLTIRDITKPVVLEVTYEGSAKDPWGNEKAAFSATTKLNRRDFGLTWSKLLETGALVVGDEVTVNLDIQGKKVGA